MNNTLQKLINITSNLSLKKLFDTENLFLSGKFWDYSADVGFTTYKKLFFQCYQPKFRRRINFVDQRGSDVENGTKSDVGFSTLYNYDTPSVSDIETTLGDADTTVFQRCRTLFQH